MKKLLLASVACGALAIATPASADGVKLELGGHLKGYGVYTDQDEVDPNEVRDFDILRETEIHFNGETTLDNGLTVGVHVEADLDAADDDTLTGNGDEDFTVEESYAYFSGNWGRVNFGQEDGAAYLLQVEAPSADSNIDGIRQFVQGVNYDALTGSALGNVRFDYDQAISGFDNKITYITPVFSGFQAGISYTPEANDTNNGLGGVSLDDEATAGDATFGDIIDVAFRYEGQFDEVGVTFGAGYTTASLEDGAAYVPGVGDATDDRDAYNIGLDLDWGPFGLGVVYTEDNFGDLSTGADEIDDEETLVVGVDYTHGAYKIGASYYTQDNSLQTEDLETDRYAVGVTYTYGPGMTFRGSVQYIEHEEDVDTALFGAGEEDADATSILLGTQINF